MGDLTKKHTDHAIAAAIKRQRAIALHYIQIMIDLDQLEAEAIEIQTKKQSKEY